MNWFKINRDGINFRVLRVSNLNLWDYLVHLIPKSGFLFSSQSSSGSSLGPLQRSSSCLGSCCWVAAWVEGCVPGNCCWGESGSHSLSNPSAVGSRHFRLSTVGFCGWQRKFHTLQREVNLRLAKFGARASWVLFGLVSHGEVLFLEVFRVRVEVRFNDYVGNL